MLDSKVIVDNSTITAIQRISGNIKVPKNYSIEGDYSAFENFISALLFYDDFYFIDDYKNEFTSGRKEEFPYIRTISPATFPYADIEAATVDITKDLILEIRAGNLAPSAITEFLEVMELSLTAAWHMRSSDYFLTLKVLSDNPDCDSERYKYSPLTSMIFNQLNGREHDPTFDGGLYLESNTGEQIPVSGFQDGRVRYEIDSELVDFSNSLNWLARRATFYVLVAGNFGTAFCMHPIRHNFVNSLAKEKPIFGQSKIWRDQFREFFGKNAKEAVNKINAATEATEIGIMMPLFAAWAVGKAGNVTAAIDRVLDIRMDPTARKMRAYFNELDEARLSAPKREINKLFAAVEAEKNKICSKFGIQTAESPNVSVSAGLGTSLGVSASKSISISELGLKYGAARNVRGVFRNVVNDIVRFPNLGNVRSKLLRQIRRDDESREHTLRIEEKKFRYHQSHWKVPM